MAGESTPARIMIVEDEALIAREIQLKLTNMGWEVVGHAFGEEAVELAIETQPDLLLSDINLRHGLSGIDLAQRIQEEVDVPVVFLTAYSDEETVARAKTVTPFGYIIKPVENRDLQITIEMALYKFRVDKELRENQQLLQNALACIGSGLIFLDTSGSIINVNQDARELLGDEIHLGRSWQTLLDETQSVSRTIAGALRDNSLAKLPPFLLQRKSGPTKLVDGILGPMDEGAVLILRDLGNIEDPVQLSADERYAMLGVDQLSPSESSFCQLLISPDNVRDADLAPIANAVRETLDASLRATDLISVFANSVVSISLPYTELADGEQISQALLEQLSSYRHAERLVAFSAGLAHSTGGDQAPIELFRRASNALETARRSGGARLWVDGGQPDIDARELGAGKDYRHVVLLWNVMNALGGAETLEAMCDDFCKHVFQVYQAERAALLTSDGGRVNLSVGYTTDHGRTERISDLALSESEFAVANQVARKELNAQILSKTTVLSLADRWVLMVSGTDFSEDDHAFLETLCTYFASSITRFEVPAPSVKPVENAAPDHNLVFSSTEMQQVLDTADLAAPTDATVLLFGESGTGKELVARYIHAKGSRHHQPLIVVDCGAVAPSLIESELFGHVKGAFTGATSNFKGRLKEAHGGTVLLDEIGELPLDTQVKLLRFVQDRQLAAVGSNQYETVDARVIAATNKDLKEMVHAGQFREDLFYRLNVFSISVPPLRDRSSDVLKIATHYLQQFAARYNKTITGFTGDAEQALQQYDWPGNVRELSNVINRAVILSKDQLVNSIQLGVFGAGDAALVSDPEPVTGLRPMLRNVIDLANRGTTPMPAGRYVEEDFILMSINHHDGVLNRAAMTIGMPESTLRRKVQKIEQDYGAAAPQRPDGWPVTPELYAEVMRVVAEDAGHPLELLANLLFEEINSRDLSKTISAQLLGVSLPTYRRFVEESAKVY